MVASSTSHNSTMSNPPPQYHDDDNYDSDESSHLDEEDVHLDDRLSLIEMSPAPSGRLPLPQDRESSSRSEASRSSECCTTRRKALLLSIVLSILYLVLKYDLDELKWVVTEIEIDLLGSRCVNASFVQSEPNTEPFVAYAVPIDYNFSAFEPLGGGRFTEYKDGDSPFDISDDMKTRSNYVAVSRRFHVVNAMKHVWKNYIKHAFGKDELLPVSGKGSDNWGGMGVTLVDALDTLWIMGLRDEFQHGRDWVKANLTHTLIGEVSTFETTKRSLGGLISAYDLSDDIVFLKQAEYLGPRLFKAFDSPSGLPRGRVNLRTGTSHLSGAGNSYVLAEVASLQLEFNFMAKATGKDEYRTKSEKVFDILKRITPRDGLLPVNLKEKRGGKAYFSNNVVSFGGMGDSAYEYMLKLWLQGGKKDMKYRDMWDRAMNGMHHHLLKKSTPNGLTYIADRSNSHVGNEMSHLTCFMAGALALGAYTDPEGLNSPRAERDLKTAKALAYTCYQMYARSATGLSPESVVFYGCTDFTISKTNYAYMLRPEAVESFYYLHHLTGDPVYREWGWEIFQAIEKYCKTQYGYASLKNVDLLSLHQLDKMESFFLAETLKYLFLLFDPSSDIDVLNKHVFNTEAHLLQVFED